MNTKTRIADLSDWDAAERLDSEESISEYLASIMEEGNSDLLAAALGDIARARGMSAVARDAGMTREALYKALRPGSHPRFDTIAKVCAALGLKMQFVPA